MSHKRREIKGSTYADFFVYTTGIDVPRDVTLVLVHHSVEALPEHVFANCKHLKEVKLQEGVREIGAAAFHNCRLLKHIYLPSSLTKIGDCALAGCTSLRELVLPEGLTEINEQAFLNCVSLERICVPSTVTTIGDYAFYECTSLKVVRLVDGIRTIGDSAFIRCKSLHDIMLPVTLTAIGAIAFHGCDSLELVKICGGIQRIAVEAFAECTLLDHVVVPSKALVITSTQGNRQFHVATDSFAPSDSKQVVIVSECFNSLRAADMSEAQLRITEILNPQGKWDTKRERLRDLFAPYELRHKKEVTSKLELGLWKAKMEESNRGNPETKEGCRFNCAAAIVVPNVLPFL